MNTDEFITQQQAAWENIVTLMREDPLFCAINKGSVNGPGSSMGCTTGLREELPQLLRHYQVQTMLDAPCGDLTWIKATDLSFLHSYIGMDVESRIVKDLQTAFHHRHGYAFVCTNLLTRKKFPTVDLILCRDFFSHITTEHITNVISKFKDSGSTYLLASNYPGADNNFDYHPEEFPWIGYLEREHDLETEPFGLQKIDSIPEQSAPGGVLRSKHELALFQLN